MTTDSSECTVRITVRWMDGQLQLHGGGKLPALVNNASADLVMQANCLADEDQRVRWSRKNTSHMLDTGTELFVRVQLVGNSTFVAANFSSEATSSG